MQSLHVYDYLCYRKWNLEGNFGRISDYGTETNVDADINLLRGSYLCAWPRGKCGTHALRLVLLYAENQAEHPENTNEEPHLHVPHTKFGINRHSLRWI